MWTSREFDRLFSECTTDILRNCSFYAETNNYLVKIDGDNLVLSFDLPGVKKEDLSVTTSGQVLKIVSKRNGKESKSSWNISKDYNPESVDATLADGVLTLKISKSSSATTKTIEVKTA